MRGSSSVVADEAVAQEYNRIGLALAVFAALFLFGTLWLVNGYFTARTVRTISIALGFASLSWGTGWLVHVVVSLIEHHLWRLRETLSRAPRIVIQVIYCLVVIVGVLDVLTSTVAFMQLFAWLGYAPFNLNTVLVSVIFAEIIAIIPEQIIVWLIVALMHVIHNEE